MRTQMTIDEPLVLEGAKVDIVTLGNKTEPGVVNAPPTYVFGKGWEYSVRFADGSGWLTIGESAVRIPKA